MAIRFTNTLSGVKEDLQIPKGRPLHLFVCGPTVYDEIHIGNARTYAVFDTLSKYLRSKHIRLFYLTNITDVDDKIINRANDEGVDAKIIAARYIKAFRSASKKLRLDSVDRYAPATKFIPQIIRQIQTLITKGNAYEIKGDGWYFDLETFPDYGKLAKRTVLQAEDGTSRIDENPEKRNRGDFCLWKFSKQGEPVWKAPFGDGRPGWHIEDTAITEHFFGPQYDLHGGGSDLIFPHHEAEIAQQEAASHLKPLVKIWLHSGLVTVDGRKMSKSLGNFMTVSDFLARYSVNTFRLLVARHHYRSSINFADSLVRETETVLAIFEEILSKLALVSKKAHATKTTIHLDEFEHLFTEAMDDDFNTPEAIAAIFKMVNMLNTNIWNLSRTDAQSATGWIMEKLLLFGVIPRTQKIPLRIRKMTADRERLRRHQQFIQSDALRKKIEALGYTLDDTPLGPLIFRK
ncbi:MAG: cysteine--tRNA ligase [Patescibacteria group bacterium]